MAHLMSHFWPGATVDQYEATVAVVHPPRGVFPRDRPTTPPVRPTGAC